MIVNGDYTGVARQGIGACLIARFASIYGTGAASPVATEGNLIKQVDVASIAVNVFSADNIRTGDALAPTAASTIFDTIQTAATWGNIEDGGNFRYYVPGSYFPIGETTNRVEVVITLTDGHKLPAVWSIKVYKMLS